MTGRPARLALAGTLIVGGAAALAALSNVPYTFERADHSVIRLAWRARGERVRQCRRLTPAEVEKRPPHMRQEEVCERRILPYRLLVAVDDVTVVDETIRAGGAREDRPLFVFRELAVTPGTRRIRVSFERPDSLARGGERETPPRLTLDESVRLAPGRIVLVTYDDERRQLRLIGGP